MARKPSKKPKQAVKAEVSEALPPGIKLLHTFKGHINTMAFNSQGVRLAIAGGAPGVKLLDVRSGKLTQTLEVEDGSIYSVAFDPQGQTLASGGPGSAAKLWDIENGKLIRTLEATTQSIAWRSIHKVKRWPAGTTTQPLSSGMFKAANCFERCKGTRPR